jgi:hypothetical protein
MSSLFSDKSNEADKKELPEWLYCALTNEVLRNPVWLSKSKNPVNYEKKALEDYFEENGCYDPKTGEPVDETQVCVNYALLRKIEDFIRDNPDAWPKIPLSIQQSR